MIIYGSIIILLHIFVNKTINILKLLKMPDFEKFIENELFISIKV
jgi:hypothetical protein